MMAAEALKGQGLAIAWIIDDAYDEEPFATDLKSDKAWGLFFDDSKEAFPVVFPEFQAAKDRELRDSDQFVRAAWQAKEKLGEAVWNHLFQPYVNSRGAERLLLDQLESRLQTLGLKTRTMGRAVVQIQGESPDIVFVDLYLGPGEDGVNITRATARLKAVVGDREDDPPLVVLMSRSMTLDDKKEDFRDQSGMIGASFRAHQKSDLVAGPILEATLCRLASQRPDAVLLTRFVNAWRRGLSGAADRFMTTIRKLDLSDYVQMQQLLLNDEKQPLGSYLFDVFDRVLRYEVEGDNHTIEAAKALSAFKPKGIAVPHFVGSPELQLLVSRVIAQNPKRLEVPSTETSIPVAFGDILIRQHPALPNVAQGTDKKASSSEPTSLVDATARPTDGMPSNAPAAPAAPCGDASSNTAKSAEEPSKVDDAPDALFVMTPACDLTRDVKRILMLAGKAISLEPKLWDYKLFAELRTPIVVLPGGRHISIVWDETDIRSLTPAEASDLLKETYQVVVRLRDSRALETQQKALAKIGRVGLVQHMPASFLARLQVYYFDLQGTPVSIDVPALHRYPPRFVVGVQDEERVFRISLTEPVIDGIGRAVFALPDTEVHLKSRLALAAIKRDSQFSKELEGLAVNRLNLTKQITVVSQAGQKTPVATICCGLEISKNLQSAVVLHFRVEDQQLPALPARTLEVDGGELGDSIDSTLM